ncbi:hypothetical protein HPB51_022042 [Rhipicephalus microplus]|uniref:Uncharacterized protein n=1 Tax=Rhipicephalus microplus TaxID=6941 RepID=A0A9J6DWK4_RHIMP|nr:hypothetical protein HPB51_022042 [Rhipicephalus microplus]
MFADVAFLVAEPFVALDCWRRLRRATMVTSPSSTVSVGGTESSGTGVQISFHANVVGSYLRKAEAAICGCSRGEVLTQSAFGATLGRASVAPTRGSTTSWLLVPALCLIFIMIAVGVVALTTLAKDEDVTDDLSGSARGGGAGGDGSGGPASPAGIIFVQPKTTVTTSANHQSDNTVTSAEPKSSYDSANHASNNDTNHASTDGSSSDNTYNDNIHRNASCGYRKHYYHAAVSLFAPRTNAGDAVVALMRLRGEDCCSGAACRISWRNEGERFYN